MEKNLVDFVPLTAEIPCPRNSAAGGREILVRGEADLHEGRLVVLANTRVPLIDSEYLSRFQKDHPSNGKKSVCLDGRKKELHHAKQVQIGAGKVS